MLTRMAQESGIETPTAEDLVRLDRKRKGKKLSHADWESPTDPDARIAKLKDGRTHLAYKPEHAMDLDTGAVVAAEMHLADQGDTTTMPGTFSSDVDYLHAVDATIADKGYRSQDALGPWKSKHLRGSDAAADRGRDAPEVPEAGIRWGSLRSWSPTAG